jgi:NAD(P)-dependent dehydrogenase (short-subunit alcohol dehydrogenase family)
MKTNVNGEARLNGDLFSLAGRAALVTGGNGGLGRAMALGLRAAGACVAVTGRRPEKNAAIAAELGDAGGRPAGRARAALAFWRGRH